MNKHLLNPIVEYLSTYGKDVAVIYMDEKPISAYKNNGENLVFFDNERRDTVIDVNKIVEVSVSAMTLTIELANGKLYNFIAMPFPKKERVIKLLETIKNTLLYDICPEDYTFWENNKENITEVLRCIKELKELNED